MIPVRFRVRARCVVRGVVVGEEQKSIYDGDHMFSLEYRPCRPWVLTSSSKWENTNSAPDRITILPEGTKNEPLKLKMSLDNQMGSS